MPMQMGWRWYGEGNDPITLSDIKQIPGVTSIVWALHHKMPGEIWEENEIKEVMDQIHAYGFNGDVVESVNVHDDIKIGLLPATSISKTTSSASATCPSLALRLSAITSCLSLTGPALTCSTLSVMAPPPCSIRRI